MILKLAQLIKKINYDILLAMLKAQEKNKSAPDFFKKIWDDK